MITTRVWFIFLTLLAFDVAQVTATCDLPWEPWVYNNKNYCFLIKTKTNLDTWDNAVSMCANANGRLPMTRNKDDFNALQNFVDTKLSVGREVWLGLTNDPDGSQPLHYDDTHAIANLSFTTGTCANVGKTGDLVKYAKMNSDSGYCQGATIPATASVVCEPLDETATTTASSLTSKSTLSTLATTSKTAVTTSSIGKTTPTPSSTLSATSAASATTSTTASTKSSLAVGTTVTTKSTPAATTAATNPVSSNTTFPLPSTNSINSIASASLRTATVTSKVPTTAAAIFTAPTGLFINSAATGSTVSSKLSSAATAKNPSTMTTNNVTFGIGSSIIASTVSATLLSLPSTLSATPVNNAASTTLSAVGVGPALTTSAADTSSAFATATTSSNSKNSDSTTMTFSSLLLDATFNIGTATTTNSTTTIQAASTGTTSVATTVKPLLAVSVLTSSGSSSTIKNTMPAVTPETTNTATSIGTNSIITMPSTAPTANVATTSFDALTTQTKFVSSSTLASFATSQLTTGFLTALTTTTKTIQSTEPMPTTPQILTTRRLLRTNLFRSSTIAQNTSMSISDQATQAASKSDVATKPTAILSTATLSTIERKSTIVAESTDFTFSGTSSAKVQNAPTTPEILTTLKNAPENAPKNKNAPENVPTTPEILTTRRKTDEVTSSTFAQITSVSILDQPTQPASNSEVSTKPTAFLSTTTLSTSQRKSTIVPELTDLTSSGTSSAKVQSASDSSISTSSTSTSLTATAVESSVSNADPYTTRFSNFSPTLAKTTAKLQQMPKTNASDATTLNVIATQKSFILESSTKTASANLTTNTYKITNTFPSVTASKSLSTAKSTSSTRGSLSTTPTTTSFVSTAQNVNSSFYAFSSNSPITQFLTSQNLISTTTITDAISDAQPSTKIARSIVTTTLVESSKVITVIVSDKPTSSFITIRSTEFDTDIPAQTVTANTVTSYSVTNSQSSIKALKKRRSSVSMRTVSPTRRYLLTEKSTALASSAAAFKTIGYVSPSIPVVNIIPTIITPNQTSSAQFESELVLPASAAIKDTTATDVSNIAPNFDILTEPITEQIISNTAANSTTLSNSGQKQHSSSLHETMLSKYTSYDVNANRISTSQPPAVNQLLVAPENTTSKSISNVIETNEATANSGTKDLPNPSVSITNSDKRFVTNLSVFLTPEFVINVTSQRTTAISQAQDAALNQLNSISSNVAVITEGKTPVDFTNTIATISNNLDRKFDNKNKLTVNPNEAIRPVFATINLATTIELNENSAIQSTTDKSTNNVNVTKDFNSATSNVDDSTTTREGDAKTDSVNTAATKVKANITLDSSFTNATIQATSNSFTESSVPEASITKSIDKSDSINAAGSSSASIINANKSNKDTRASQPTTAASSINYNLDLCQTADWEPYSFCGSTCGEAVKVRHRRRHSLINESVDCPIETESVSCELPRCNPMTNIERTASNVMMNIGCVWIVSGLSLAIISFLCFRHHYYLQIIHVNQDISLALAHLTLLIFAGRNDDRFTHDVCKIAALALQYLFGVSFLLQGIEALHIYTVLTNVVWGNNVFLAMKSAMAIAWGVPAVITGVTGAAFYNNLMSDFSCWINLGDNVLLATFLPAASVAWITVILLEATGRGSTCQKSSAVTSCRVAHGALVAVFGAHFASWVMSSVSIYYQHVGLFTIVFGLNVVFGIVIYICHVFSNQKARDAAMNLCRRIRGKQAVNLVR